MRRVDLVAPEIFETRWRQLGITHGVLDILVSEIVLDRSLINLKCPNFITECANSDSTDGSVRATRSPRYRAPRLLVMCWATGPEPLVVDTSLLTVAEEM